MDRDKLNIIRGFLMYMSITYQDMNPYIKGLHMSLDSWRLLIDEVRGKQLKL